MIKGFGLFVDYRNKNEFCVFGLSLFDGIKTQSNFINHIQCQTMLIRVL
jgi:hypothetical protein